jgi:Ser/Thr protein kinase RdoA (MazF antagonist)
MPDISLVSGLVETIYGFSPVAIEPIQRYVFDWRGIFRVYQENGQCWVLRLLKHPEASKDFHSTATLLQWLDQQGYPVPHIHRTREQQLVGIKDNWTLLLLSFIEGEIIKPEPSSLQLLSARLGQLHALPHDSAPTARRSRCHPETIANRTIPQLDTGCRLVPEVYVPLFRRLSASMSAFLRMEDLHFGITHGDCWYLNAVRSDVHDVQLIDWDNVGIGAPVLDLGYLLLSSHFRLDEPFCAEPDRDRVQAIMEGYQTQYPLSLEEVRSLIYAVHFPLACHLGMYSEQNAPLHEEDLFLKKTQQRFKYAVMIGEMAGTYGP